eukprot:CAMPEP_0179909208 /NCGR_PEP_ID=MMETSP0982-20121206/45096_1 /TAXON_ID=483367 /ORGANISM="non described non described, Strain CCMP 2436" /LENGTH=152 /DNA_ID=CAMNT_0021810649 /DNA_START=187 /DNA_END=642 /DNA_ORIENTATION=+
MRTTSAARCRSSRRGAQAREGCKRASHAGDLSGPPATFQDPGDTDESECARPSPPVEHLMRGRAVSPTPRTPSSGAINGGPGMLEPDPGLPGGEHTCSRASSAKGPARSAHVLDLLARADCVRALDRPQAPVRARAWQDREGPVQCVRAAGV